MLFLRRVLFAGDMETLPVTLGQVPQAATESSQFSAQCGTSPLTIAPRASLFRSSHCDGGGFCAALQTNHVRLSAALGHRLHLCQCPDPDRCHVHCRLRQESARGRPPEAYQLRDQYCALVRPQPVPSWPVHAHAAKHLFRQIIIISAQSPLPWKCRSEAVENNEPPL
jgi:hypothetical protein